MKLNQLQQRLTATICYLIDLWCNLCYVLLHEHWVHRVNDNDRLKFTENITLWFEEKTTWENYPLFVDLEMCSAERPYSSLIFTTSNSIGFHHGHYSKLTLKQWTTQLKSFKSTKRQLNRCMHRKTFTMQTCTYLSACHVPIFNSINGWMVGKHKQHD